MTETNTTGAALMAILDRVQSQKFQDQLEENRGVRGDGTMTPAAFAAFLQAHTGTPEDVPSWMDEMKHAMAHVGLHNDLEGLASSLVQLGALTAAWLDEVRGRLDAGER